MRSGLVYLFYLAKHLTSSSKHAQGLSRYLCETAVLPYAAKNTPTEDFEEEEEEEEAEEEERTR